VETDDLTGWRRVGHRLKNVLDGTIAGAIVTVIGFFDDSTVGPIVVALAAVLPALLTFAITAVVYSLVQYWASMWLSRHWAGWISSKRGRRAEARLEKWRQGRILGRVVRGLTSGSVWWYAVASLAFAAVDVVAIWNLSSDKPLPQRRILVAAVVYGTWCAVLWTSAGYGVGFGIRSA
jgi:hypothetical protein